MADDSKITLIRRTRESCHAFYQALVQDPVLFEDGESYQPYQYNPGAVDAFFHKRERQRDRVGFSVLLGDTVIGDVSLKHIDREKRCCELEICMTNDRVKNRGYGTQAEQLAVQYAFEQMAMEMVLADCLEKNARSQHVLEKVGFELVSQSQGLRLYCMTKERYLQVMKAKK